MKLAVIGCLLAAAAAQAETIENCVGGEALRIEPAQRHAWLDNEDRAAASAAIARRFPMLARDGFAPSRLLLWERPGAGWLYVALLQNPQKPGESCFTATVTAAVVDVTRMLMRKYFPGQLGT